MRSASTQRTLWALLFGNLVIGTGVLLPAGMLTALMSDLQIDAATAGLMMLVGGLVVGVGAPVLAALTSRVDRRLLLVFALALYVVGHVGSVLTRDITVLLVFRGLTVAGAAIFTPQAAATVGLLVPPEQRGGSIAFIFIGWSLASVLGIPLGALLGAALGWQITFLLMAVLSFVGAVLVWLVVPGGLRVAPLQLASWVRVLTDPKLLLVLSVTMLAIAGQFALFTYLTPILAQDYGMGANASAAVFLAGGVAGVIGNIVFARIAGPVGVERSVQITLALVAVGLAVVWAGWGNYWLLLAGLCLWEIGGFAVNSLQQGRLVALAPVLASATVALNTSFVYLGQSLGAAAGGALIERGAGPGIAAAGIGFVVLAMVRSAAASAVGRNPAKA